VIGAERQWRQRTAGLRTYALVAVGSTRFVIVGCLVPDTGSTRMASYVVSGVGFLGAGVIHVWGGRKRICGPCCYVVLKAILSSHERIDAQVELLVSRLSLEKDLVGITWQLLPQHRTD